MVALKEYIPDRGDLIWITLNPQAGYEQAGYEQSGHEQAGLEQSGRRPAVVLSPAEYNRKVGLSVLCPVTSRIKGYPFEVLLPDDLDISGAILSDQVKSLDWRSRKADFIGKLPENITMEVLSKLNTIIGI